MPAPKVPVTPPRSADVEEEPQFWDARKLKPIGIGIAALLAISVSYVGVRALTKPSVKPPPIVAQPSPAAPQPIATTSETAAPQIATATETAAPALTNSPSVPEAAQNVAPPNQVSRNCGANVNESRRHDRMSRRQIKTRLATRGHTECRAAKSSRDWQCRCRAETRCCCNNRPCPRNPASRRLPRNSRKIRQTLAVGRDRATPVPEARAPAKLVQNHLEPGAAPLDRRQLPTHLRSRPRDQQPRAPRA